jgi:hypothetical protein
MLVWYEDDVDDRSVEEMIVLDDEKKKKTYLPSFSLLYISLF